MESKKQDTVGDKVLAGQFNLTQQLPNGRTMQIIGYTFDGETTDELNVRVDNFQSVMERQRRRFEIPELEAKLDQLNIALTQTNDAYTELLERNKNGKTTSQEKMNVRNYPITIKHLQEEIVKGEAALAQAKKDSA